MPGPYNDTSRLQCNNRMNRPAGTQCRAANAATCLNRVNCTGFSEVCAVEEEILSVTNTSAAALRVVGAYTTASGVAYLATPGQVRFSLTGVTTPTGCPVISPANLRIGIASVPVEVRLCARCMVCSVHIFCAW